MMKGLIYHEFQGPIIYTDLPDPSIAPHGALIEVRATGLCRSDWHGWMGHDADIRLPHVPGHELAGVIVEVGKNVRHFKVGDRVTVPFVCGCGSCRPCQAGQQQVCDNQSQPGFTHWGSFADLVAIEQADLNLVHLPEGINFQTAAILGCRFITSFRAIVDQGKVQAGQYVAIHGCGGVGLSAIMIAKAMGALPIAIDIRADALAFAKKLGAVATVQAGEAEDVVEAVKELSHGGVQVSLDALGHSETCFNSVANLRKQGKHIQVGLMTAQHQHPKIPMDMVIAKELEILGSHGMQAHRYPELLQMIKAGLLQPELLISKVISLEEAATALPQMDRFEQSGVQIIEPNAGR
ncbi:MAG: zinc-dependent alcohol dehydrogenase family protein [Saprospiraceae bacterium]|nr:zinc-dependent alcohol dehydrogenase family protein [Saprospiraceae bacterium]